MAKLYSFCTYNGVYGGAYQASAWDVCCDEWTDRPDGSPADWDCSDQGETNWVCTGINPQTWTCSILDLIDWADTGVNPQFWECRLEMPIDWADYGVNPQLWGFDDIDPENWIGVGLNPQAWDCAVSSVEWGDSEIPPTAEWESILVDKRAGKDCGD